MTNFYEILEITKAATSDDVKKAYRKLALRWHPDKNPQNQEEANRRFKQICAAYAILADDKKRAAYDRESARTPLKPNRHRSTRTKSTSETADFAADDIFSTVFGSKSPFKENRHKSSSKKTPSSSTRKPYFETSFDGDNSQDVFADFFKNDDFFGSRTKGREHFGHFDWGIFDMHTSRGTRTKTTSSRRAQTTSTKSSKTHVTKMSVSTITKFLNGKTYTTKVVIDGDSETTCYYVDNELTTSQVKVKAS